MKQLLIFFLLAAAAFSIDLHRLDESVLHKDTIRVTVEGAVASPGTLEVSPYISAGEVLEQAGTTEDADLSAINPDMLMKDHDVLYVPTAAPEKPKVSINTATAEELMSLPGIGASTAQQIIVYREENGLFQKTEDLMKVPGIGPAKFEKIEELIRL